MLPEKQKAWIGELREARAKAAEIVEVAPRIGQVFYLLESCAEARRQYENQPSVPALKEIGHNIASLREAMKDFPDRLKYFDFPHGEGNIKEIKNGIWMRIVDLQAWLDKNDPLKHK